MSKEELNCSFCGRAKPQTQLLIAGLDAHICDKCILQAHGIVKEETNEDQTEHKLDVELNLPKKYFRLQFIITTNVSITVREKVRLKFKKVMSF
jgi:ATP-dependent Clp protease ATP-binding subunit ClpX